MAIQFYCPGCAQAIEIDDQYAGRPIACPFCQKITDAPQTSQLRKPMDATADNAGTPLAAPPMLAISPVRGKVWIANLALLCALGAVAMVGLMVVATSEPKIREMMTAPTLEKRQELTKALSTTHQPQLALILLSSCGVIVATLAGLVFGILGLRLAPGARGRTVTGLVICGLFAIFLLLGFLLQYTQRV